MRRQWWVIFGLYLISITPVSVFAGDIATGVVLYYKLDEGTGTTTADSSGNNFTGTFRATTASPTWVTNLCVTQRVRLGLCLSMDAGDGVDLTAGSTLNLTTDFTLSFWIKTATAAHQIILGFYQHVTPFAGYGVRVESDGDLALFDSTSWIATSASLGDNTWHHCVVVHSGTTGVTFYKDGVALGTGTTGSLASWTGNRTVGNQSSGGSGGLNGQIDHIMVFNRSLTQADVSDLYLYGLPKKRQRR